MRADELHAEVRRDDDGGYLVFVNGRALVRRESLAVADRVAWFVNHPDDWEWSECCQVAESIRAWFEEGRDAGRPQR